MCQLLLFNEKSTYDFLVNLAPLASFIKHSVFFHCTHNLCGRKSELVFSVLIETSPTPSNKVVLADKYFSVSM